MSKATARTPRRRMSRADRERQMLDVAQEVFTERGYRATSMDEIAERCGVSKPMLYEYFGSKDGLLMAAMARSRAELYEQTSAAMAQGTDPQDILLRGMLAYFEFMDSRSRSFAMLLQEPAVGGGPPPGGRNEHVGPADTSEAIEETRRQQSGLITPILASFAPGVPESIVAAYTEIIIGGCERLALWRLRHPEVTAQAAAHYMTDFSWNGLKSYVA